MQFLAMHFSHYNGPYGGEQTYFLPATVAKTVGMLSLEHEAMVFERDGMLQGVIGVEYGGSGEVERRRLYWPSHSFAQQAYTVVQDTDRILGQTVEMYRLPFARSPEDFRGVLEDHGLSAFEGPYWQIAKQDDILPIVFASATSPKGD